MSYDPTTWQTGDIVTADKLNNIEDGILGVETDVNQLKSEINEVDAEIYSPPTINFTSGKFINVTGVVSDSANWALTDAIPVAPKTVVEVTTELQGNAAICILTAGGMSLGGVTGTAGVKPYTVQIPEGGAFIRISCYSTQTSKVKVRPLYVSDSLNTFINGNNSDIIRAPQESEVIDGYLMTKSGTLTASSQWEVTEFIPVYPENGLLLHCYLYGVGGLAVYDENKSLILGIDGNTASTYGGSNVDTRLQNISLTNMQNARYVRMSVWKTRFRATALAAIYTAPWKAHAEAVLGYTEAPTYVGKRCLSLVTAFLLTLTVAIKSG